MRPAWYVTWIYLSADPLPIGIGRDGCYMSRLHTRRRSVLAILRLVPAESLARAAVKSGFAGTCTNTFVIRGCSCSRVWDMIKFLAQPLPAL